MRDNGLLNESLCFLGCTYEHFLSQMLVTRLCCINNELDRGSKRMRYCSAALAVLSGQTNPCGAVLLRLATFGVFTGGLEFCRFLHQKVLATKHTCSWYESQATNGWDEMSFSEGGGNEGDGEGDSEDDTDTEKVIDEAAADDMEVQDDEPSGLSAFAKLAGCEDLARSAIALLTEFENQGYQWGSCSHKGFRPFKALGYEKARTQLKEAFERFPQKLQRGCLYRRSGVPYFKGARYLASKVLVDRLNELCNAVYSDGEKDHIFKLYAPVPCLPRVGGCAATLALVNGLTAAHGMDECGLQMEPYFVSKLRKSLVQRLKSFGFTDLAAEFAGPAGLSLTENVSCCYNKVCAGSLGITSHRAY